MADSVTEEGTKEIGVSFSEELKAANVLGLPFSWSKEGVIEFDESMSQSQIDSVMAVYNAHNPEESA